MYYVGIDIGGTTIKAGVVSINAHIIYKTSCATVKGDESAFIQKIVEVIAEVLKGAHLEIQDIQAIGLGCPGIIDLNKGVIINAGNLCLSEVSLKEQLEKRFSLPIAVNNDANCAALGEYYVYEDNAIDSFIMVTLGTGIGGGIILNQKIYTGYNGLAGEFGNMIMHIGGTEYAQVQRGCWEAYASASSLVKMAEKAAEGAPKSLLNLLIERNGGRANGELVFQALKKKDKVAEEVMEEYIKYLGEGIINILHIFQPEIIVIGGGLSQEELLLELLKKYIAENSKCFFREKHTKIKNAVLGNDAGIIGAAFLNRL